MDIRDYILAAVKAEDECASEFEQVNHYIFEHPELGLAEYESSKYLADYFKSKGFDVEYPYAGLETAFRATYGTSGPLIAFLAEYDALPGYGKDKHNAHACGHNFISASCAASAVTLSKFTEELGFRVAVIGTPAEETYCAKVAMIDSGAFNDVDIVLQAHLDEMTTTCVAALAMTSLKLKYAGRAAHSAAAPWDGINALDSAQLFFAGINALRQHVRPEMRMHGIITSGGKAANIVPDYAEILFYARAATREYLDTVLPKIENIAEGAALMTGAKLTVEYPELPLDNLVNLPVLQELADRYFTEFGLAPEGTPEHAREVAGSTDIGNVSHVCPTMYVEAGLVVDSKPFAVHDEETIYQADSKTEYELLHKTAKAFCAMAIELVKKPELIETAKVQLENR